MRYSDTTNPSSRNALLHFSGDADSANSTRRYSVYPSRSIMQAECEEGRADAILESARKEGSMRCRAVIPPTALFS